MSDSFPFLVEEGLLSDGSKFSYVDIGKLDGSAIAYLDGVIAKIYGGPCEADGPERVKKRIRRWFVSKTGDKDLIHGATAELFCHLFLNWRGYRQNFLYDNLEENSIKKGFDGLYSIGDNIWLMESKSGEKTKTNDLSHPVKVQAAYRDICSKLKDFDGNDPWQNAAYHAFLARADETIAKKIKALSNDFLDEKSPDIAEMNLVPCGTIFCSCDCGFDVHGIKDRLDRYFQDRDYGQLHIVCVTNRALDAYMSYLGVDTGE